MSVKNGVADIMGWGPRGTAAATIAARLAFKHVTRKFSQFPAVHDFNLTIEPGEIICLLGPSGCGKSTLLRLAAGIDQPTEGQILLNDKELSGPNSFIPPEKRNIGLMFQDFALFPHLTILNNVAFGLKALGRSEAEKEAKSALDRVGLLEYAQEYPHILSGGQQQRVALARAIAPRPSVLLMDEPFSGLDSRLRESMRTETLAILNETRATCIIVTHQSEEAMRMGDRIAVMKSGHLVQAGTAEELYSQPKDVFIASMFSEINEIACKVNKGKLQTPIGDFPTENINDGEKVVLCVRQNSVNLVQNENGVTGRVLKQKFLGDKILLDVGVKGLDVPLLVQVKRSQIPEINSVISVKVDPKSVLIFSGD